MVILSRTFVSARRRRLAVVASLVILSGCRLVPVSGEARYEGDLPKDKISILTVGQPEDVRGEAVMANQGLEIMRIDNTPVQHGGLSLLAYKYVNEVRLLPGDHTTLLRFNKNGHAAWAHLKFPAEAGRTYVGKYNPDFRYTVQIWIEDAETGRHVGGLAEDVKP